MPARRLPRRPSRHRPRHLPRAALLPAVLSLVLATTACGSDDDDGGAGGEAAAPGTGNASAPGSAGTTPAAAGPDVAALPGRCEELAAVAATLRGTPPATVAAFGPESVTTDGVALTSAHCTFGYGDDSFTDPDRVDVYVETAADEVDVRQVWDRIAVTGPVEGVGDLASFHTSTGTDVRSSARALLGATLVSVRVSVPKSEAGAAYLSQEALTAALQEVVADLS